MRPLFGGSIPRLKAIENVKAVPIGNTSEAQYAVDDEHRQWVRKSVEFTAYEPLLAEAIAWLLAKEIGVPIPSAAVFGEGDDLSWMSSLIPAVIHWNPMQVPFIHNLDGLGCALALDAVLLNRDRHIGNVLLQPDPDQLRLKLWAIDFGDALVGHPDDFAAAGLELVDMPSANLMPGIPVDLVREGADTAARLAANLPSGMIRSFVQEACELAREPKGQILESALIARLAIAPTLTDSYLSKIEKKS